MKRLSFLDALFLYAETPKTPMHVASVTIFKPTSPRDDFFARFREHVAARLELLPSYRRRLQATPLGIDHPVWVIEDKLDLDYHIRHQALPKPGGMQELRNLIGRLHAVPLDRGRPLWEYHFIEGLEGDAFAVYVKVHHSTMDGLAGMATLGVTYDFAPGAEHENLPLRIVPQDAEPSDLIELTSTAVGDFIRQGWRAAKSLPERREGVEEGCPQLRPRCAFSLWLRQGHASDAIQQGDLRTSGIRNVIASSATRSRRSPSRGAPRSTTSCWRSALAPCGATSPNMRRCPKGR